MDPGSGGLWTAETREGGQAASRAQNEGTAGTAGAPDGVTFEDVAVGFSLEEWSLLEGSQKDLHQEVMLEMCSLLRSLGHSVPTVNFSSLTRQSDETAKSPRLSWGRRRPFAEEGDKTHGGEPPCPEDMKEFCNLQLDSAEEHLAAAGDEAGRDQSSHHLCALMKLVNEIPEFLCGHVHAGLERSTPAGGSEGRGHASPAVQLKSSPHFGRLEPLTSLVSLSASSPAKTPSSSSPEGDWSEPTSQGTFAPCDAQGLKGAEVAACAESLTKENLAERQLKSEEGLFLWCPRLSMEQKHSPEMDPRLDTDDSSADSGCLDQSRSWGDGGAEEPVSPGTLQSISEAGRQSEDGKTVPEAAAEKELLKRSGEASPKSVPEARSEEKPLQGLLKCLKELVTLQPGRSPQGPLKASIQRRSETLGVRQRGGRNDALPRQVKREASEEELGVPNPREGPGSSLAAKGNPSIPQPEGGRRPNFPVKIEQVGGSSSWQDPQGEPALVVFHASGSWEKTPERSGTSAVCVKSEEELPLRGHEDILEEKGYPHFGLPRSSFSLGARESGSKLELSIPYSDEWSPATSPLHGLLNCLKDIPVARPLTPKVTMGKQRATGEKERHRGGRRGRFGPPPDPCLPQSSEAGHGEKPAQQPLLPHGYANRPHERNPPGRKVEAAMAYEGTTKERPPPSAHIQPSSPAIISLVSSSPDSLPRWTPEPGRWRRKEDELGQAQSPLPGLGKGFKETPWGSRSRACSPATSSSPDGLHRRTSARREEGFSQSSTPLQGLEKCLKDIQSQRWSPSVTSSIHSSPDRRRQWTPEPATWARKEEGGSPPRVPPLQGLENCLNEIAPSRDFLNASPARRGVGAQKRAGTEEAHSPRPGPAGTLPQQCASASDTAADSSPLHRLMNCLKEIPIRRPSYLNTPNAFSSSSSSSSSSCSETERDQQSPGNSAWWDSGLGRHQPPGSERDVLVGPKVTMEPKREHLSTQFPAEEEEKLASAQEADVADSVDEAPSASLLGNPENDAKDTGVKQMFPSITPLQRSGTQRAVTSRASEAREDVPPSAPLVNKIFTHELKKDPRDTTSARTPRCSSPMGPGSRDGTSQGDTDWSPGEEQVQPLPGDQGLTGSRPLQGLLSCLEELAYPSTPRPCPSLARKRPRQPQHNQEEEEEEQAAHCKKKSWQGAVSSSAPTCDEGTSGPQQNGHSCPRNSWSSAHMQSDPPRWNPPASFRMGARRASATARDKGRLPALDAGPEAKNSRSAAPGLCSCSHGAESGAVQPLVSKQLGRLAADVSSLCRDLSGLQSHVLQLEQDARCWALELAALHLENHRLDKYARRLENRCRALESRSRRANLRLLGLPEGAEGGDPAAFLRRALPELLGWRPGAPVLEIESARRIRSWDSSGKPRPLLFRVSRSADRAAVLEAARSRPLRFAEAQLAILPDLGAPRRRPPPAPFRRSRWVADLLFGGRPIPPCTPLVAVGNPGLPPSPGSRGGCEQHNL
ncbi:uncharacterized protein LOC120317782 isoform X3 [Crotalus tigris]|uniref:uncharacterized protein LOC120317782 isoform X3 n=1 Tax=Crotalus tigris TaxID=88082 RepID=UPI00192F7C57|nr:uncharacterized protein LOC120317782 isoform X3 [Crotalus tigris]